MHGSHHDEVSAPDASDVADAAERSSRAWAAVHELTTTRDPAGVERVVDELTNAGARRWTGDLRRELVEGLVLCLAGDSIREDPDSEDALCSLLEELGLMRRAGNLVFEFTPDRELASADLSAVRRYRAWIPIRYTTDATAATVRVRRKLLEC